MPDTGVQLPLIASRSIKQLLMSAVFLFIGLMLFAITVKGWIPDTFGWRLSHETRTYEILSAVHAILGLLVSAGMLFGSLKLLVDFLAPCPLIIVNEKGLRDLRISKQEILWADVVDYRVRRSYRGGTRTLSVGLKVRTRPTPNSALLGRIGQGIWHSKTSPWVTVSTAFLSVNSNRLADSIVALIKQNAPPSTDIH